MNDATQAVIGVTLFASIAVSVKAIAGAVATVWTKRLEFRRASAPAAVIEERLERIESAVDAIALEVERIAEAQRFTARLTAERASSALPAPERPPEGRVVTPH